MENNTKYLTLFNGKTASIILPWSFVLCFIISVALLIAGFLTPPIGIIDGSCLSAVGEIIAIPTIMYALRTLEMGMKIKLQKGDASIEITKKTEEE